MRRWTAEERIAQINSRPNIEFVRWVDGYVNKDSKVVVRCTIDGNEWAPSTHSLLNANTGCPQCGTTAVSMKLRVPAEGRIQQINQRHNVTFVRWESDYRNHHSKAVCRCTVDGFEWAASVGNLIKPKGTGCPKCAEYGYNAAKQGTLYLLRSECGSMVKIGISNNYEQRHDQLRRHTPFNWSCIELLHGDGATIADLEKELHGMTEQAKFSQTFDGSTEWRKWDDRLPMWLKRYRARLERYNKAP